MAHERNRASKADLIEGVGLTLVVCFLLILAHEPQEVTLFSNGDSMVWPRYVLWPLLMLALALIFKGAWGAAKAAVSVDGYRHLLRPLALGLVYIVCFALVGITGFLLAALIFTASASVVMGRQRPITVVVFAVCTALVVWLAFAKGLNLPLPRGIGVFRDLNYLLY